MYQAVDPQVFISQRLIAHASSKTSPNPIPVDLWERQRICEAFKICHACERVCKSARNWRSIRVIAWTGDSWA